jgi:hypothetical protein
VLATVAALGATGCGADCPLPQPELELPSDAVLRADPASFYRAEWTLLDAPLAVRPQERAWVLVSLRNASRWTWPDPQLADPVERKGARAVRLAWRWLRVGEELPLADFTRVDLPYPLPAGEAIELPLDVQAPPEPGQYHLQVVLVHEMLEWFTNQGAQELRVPIAVDWHR